MEEYSVEGWNTGLLKSRVENDTYVLPEAKKTKKTYPPDIPDKEFDYKLAMNYARKALQKNGIEETGRAQWDKDGSPVTQASLLPGQERKEAKRKPSSADDTGVEHDVVQSAFVRYWKAKVGHNGKPAAPMSTRRAIRREVKEYLRSQKRYSWYVECPDNVKYGPYVNKRSASREAKRARLDTYDIVPYEGNVRVHYNLNAETGAQERRLRGHASKAPLTLDRMEAPRDTMLDLIDVLPTDQNAAELLRTMFAGCTVREAAEAMGIHYSSVSRRLAAYKEALPEDYFLPVSLTVPHAPLSPMSPVPDNAFYARQHDTMQSILRFDDNDTGWMVCFSDGSNAASAVYGPSGADYPLPPFTIDDVPCYPSSLDMFERFLSPKKRTITI